MPQLGYNFAGIPVFSKAETQALPKLALQAKLMVNAPGDAYEQEADRVADQVMQMAEPSPALTTNGAAGVQRKCACGGTCSDCRKQQDQEQEHEHAHVQLKAASPGSAGMAEAPPIVHELLNSPGQPLDARTRAVMESRFGWDFSKVRVHTDAKAAESAKAVNALAFTVGSHIAFGEHQYSPGGEAGRRLLAHELTHVVQQNDGNAGPKSVQRWAISGCTVPQQDYIDEAISRAYEDLRVVHTLLTERPVPDNVKNALWLAFRDQSDATADLARDNIGRLSQQIANTHFQCADHGTDSTCTETTLAYADAGTVTLCRPNFFADNMSMLAQAETVIHEAAHVYLSSLDWGYFTHTHDLCSETPHPRGQFDDRGLGGYSGTAGDNPAYRLENADSYGCLVYYLRYMGSSTLQTQGASYRGENLAIEPVDDILPELYTQVTTPELHRYRIRGVPENSGFQFRWSVQAGPNVFNPSSTGSGSASAFAEDNQVIFIPASIARFAESNHLSNVTLTCEIQLFRGTERMPARVITKTAVLRVVVGPPPIDL